VEVSEDGSDVIARSNVHCEASSGVLDSLVVDFNMPAMQPRVDESSCEVTSVGR